MRYDSTLALSLSFLALLTLPAAGVSADPVTLATNGDAYITQDDGPRAWSLGNNGITVSVAIDNKNGLQLTDISNPQTGTAWLAGTMPDTTVMLFAQAVPLGAAGSDLRFDVATTDATGTGVHLALTFVSSDGHVGVTRHYACYPGAPVVETWTSLDNAQGGARVDVSNPNAWQMAIQPGELRWLTGLELSNPNPDAPPFTLQTRTLTSGDTLNLGAVGRSSESIVPWVLVQSGADAFFGGIEWSGAWALNVTAHDDNLLMLLGIPQTTTSVSSGQTLEMPHGFFGVSAGTGAQVSIALRNFVQTGLRQGQGFSPLVADNTWFVHGAQIDQDSMRAEIDHGAAMGAELFVLDAGYYPGAGANGGNDFTPGLGTWTADPQRFPDGLGALADYARSLGLKFGIWVEPERVDMTTVGKSGLAQQSFLATVGGRYDPGVPAGQTPRAAQICLGNAQARQWVLDHLVALIDQTHADYLKWDNNFWINCDRPGHGHDVTDGNFQHVQGIYQILAALRARYPSLVIENCSGGGNRLDFGMLRYTDVAWMDDGTSPAVRVRHNLEGLTHVFPAPYLFSFVMGYDTDPAGHTLDLPLSFRSSMPGMLGIGLDASKLSDDEQQLVQQQVSIYKGLRAIQADAGASLLSDQIVNPDDQAWDALEEVSPITGNAVIFAYQNDPASDQTTVFPVNLKANATYRVTSVDHGVLGTAKGSELMFNGVGIDASPASAGHVLLLTAGGQ
jgi:alpha-galactosidase